MLEQPEAFHPDISVDEHLRDKERAWREKRSEIDRTVDGAGLGIDEGIKDTVVALNLLGFPTAASCEGHTDWGLPTPWVDVQAPGKPDETYVGENNAYQEYADRYGIPFEEVKYCQSDQGEDAWWEAQDALAETDAPATAEYERWAAENEKLWVGVEGLLDEFYAGREVDPAIQLKLSGNRLHNGSTDFETAQQHRMTEDEREQLSALLARCQKEMCDFTELLKKKYVSADL